MNYKAILFHPAGDFVTDFRDRTSKDKVWEAVADMGSRWIFYPLVFVSTDKTIVDTPEGMEYLKGKRITTVKKYLADIWKEQADQVCTIINEGLPLNWIYT